MTTPIMVPYTGAEPTQGHPTDAAWDLKLLWNATITPGEYTRLIFDTRVGIPEGYLARLTLRSSVTALGLFPYEGIIDAGYTGDLKLLVANMGRTVIKLYAGDRVGQLLFQQVTPAQFEAVEELPGSARGAGGFGSTGQ